MTYSTHTTSRAHKLVDAVLAIAYAAVIGAVAYALPLAGLLQKVTR